jgi:hydroxymethylpyrimidine/phosphomethylpyrimidine kinase
LSIVTGLTEQDSTGVAAILPTDAAFIRRALDRVQADFRIAAVKIGMLASVDVVREVAAWIDRVRAGAGDARVSVVLDPVIEASDGQPLLAGYHPGLLASLIARATIVTPNLAEAARLFREQSADGPVGRLCERNGEPDGHGGRTPPFTGADVQTDSGREAAARALLNAGAQSVLVKGGHGSGAPTDLLVTRDQHRSWTWERAAETPHGTGCATSSAIAANLALGHPLDAAVDRALAFVQHRIRSAARVGRGRPLMRFL